MGPFAVNASTYLNAVLSASNISFKYSNIKMNASLECLIKTIGEFGQFVVDG